MEGNYRDNEERLKVENAALRAEKDVLREWLEDKDKTINYLIEFIRYKLQ